MNFLKIFLIILAVLAGIGILIFSIVGLGVFALIGSLFNAADDAANHYVEQRVELVDNNVRIYVPIIENKALVIDNVSICDFGLYDDNKNKIKTRNTMCFGNTCTFKLDKDMSEENIPKYVYIDSKDSSGNCSKIKYSTIGKYITTDYSVTVEFTDKLVKLLDLEGKTNYDVNSSNTVGQSVYQFFGTKKASFDYKNKKSSYDLIIDNEKKATIIIDANTTNKL